MSQEGTTEENTEEPKVKATSEQSSSTFEGKTAEKWAEIYKGLQTAFQKMQNEKDAEIGALKTKLTDAQAEIEGFKAGGKTKDDQLTVLQTEIEKKNEAISSLEADKKAADTALQRSKIVMKDFPELASFEAQGLLPTNDDSEKLAEQLKLFSETLTGQVKTNVTQQVKEKIAGASPAGSSKTSGGTKEPSELEQNEDYYWKIMLDNSGPNGDPTKFEEAQKKYDAIQLARENNSQS